MINNNSSENKIRNEYYLNLVTDSFYNNFPKKEEFLFPIGVRTFSGFIGYNYSTLQNLCLVYPDSLRKTTLNTKYFTSQKFNINKSLIQLNHYNVNLIIIIKIFSLFSSINQEYKVIELNFPRYDYYLFNKFKKYKWFYCGFLENNLVCDYRSSLKIMLNEEMLIDVGKILAEDFCDNVRRRDFYFDIITSSDDINSKKMF